VLSIARAQSELEQQSVRELVAEYVAWDAAELRRLGFDARAAFEFYFAPEKDVLSNEYTPPHGSLLLAQWSGQPAGCVAFHRLDEQVSELKRLYVRPEYRGKQIGKGLVAAVIAAATNSGYHSMRLETVTYMQDAIALYGQFGFRRCPPYYAALETFREISLFMELDLIAEASRS
jgi:GNAT superfamily N-acetyltransferase